MQIVRAYGLIFLLITGVGFAPLAAQLSYSGWIDRHFPIRLELDQKGTQLAGKIIFPDDKSEISVAGKLKGDRIVLMEKSEEGEEMGQWELVQKENSLSGHWHWELLSQEVQLYQDSSDQQSFFQIYDSQSSQQWRLILQTTGHRTIKGSLSTLHKKRHYELVGKSDDKGLLHLDILEEGTKIFGHAQLSPSASSSMALQLGTASVQIIPLKSQSNLELEERTWSNGKIQLYMSWPLIGRAHFDLWLTQRMEQLWQRAVTYVEKTKDSSLYPGIRARLRSQGQCLISYLDDQLISGHIMYWDSWSDKQLNENFVFDLKNGQVLRPGDMLVNKEELMPFIREQVLAEYRDEAESEFFAWLRAASLDQWTLRADGLWWGTAFHPIFGQAAVPVSLQELKPYLKEGHPFEKL